jgi:predicted nucleic acid-binding protein
MTSAETLQEILYVLGRQNAPDRVTEALGVALDAAEIAPLTAEDVLLAAALKLPGRFSARDRIHRAVMERNGVEIVVSGDRDFDEAPGIRRLDPSSFDEWRDVVFGT